MINREMKAVTVNYYDGVDEYGQQLATLQGTKEIQAAFGMISKSNNNNIDYLTSTHYLLTTDSTINDKCKIIVDNHTYKVIYVNNHRVWNQVFLEW